MNNRLLSTLNSYIPQMISDEFMRYNQGDEQFAINTLYERAKKSGIAQSPGIFPFENSLIVINGNKKNILEVTVQGNGANPDPISRKPLFIIEKMAGTENIINMKGINAIENRKRIKPFLSEKKAMSKAFESSKHLIKKVLQQWKYEKTLQENISYFTINVISNCVLGIPEVSFQEAEIINKAGRALAQGNTKTEQFAHSVKEMHQLNDQLLGKYYKVILGKENYSKAKADLMDGKDELDKLQKTRSISNLLVEANLSTLIMAALVYTNKDQEILNKLRKEIQETKEMDLATLRSLPYLECVYKESLRYISPTAVIIRQTSKSVDLNIVDDKNCKKVYKTHNRSLLFAPIRRIHHDSNYWDYPEKFNPERFLNKDTLKHFIPFSLGQRSCPAAAHFNEIVFKTALAEIIKFDIELDKEVETIPKDALTSRWQQDYFVTKLKPENQSSHLKPY